MNNFDFQSYLLPALVVGFLVWRLYRFRRAKSKVPELLKKGAVIVDVRSPGEYASGFAPGSINIPLNELGKRVRQLDPKKPVILCCASGTRSGMAAAILKQNGFENVTNAGPWTNTLAES